MILAFPRGGVAIGFEIAQALSAKLTANQHRAFGSPLARIYRGIPLFGRTEILIRDPELSFDGRC